MPVSSLRHVEEPRCVAQDPSAITGGGGGSTQLSEDDLHQWSDGNVVTSPGAHLARRPALELAPQFPAGSQCDSSEFRRPL